MRGPLAIRRSAQKKAAPSSATSSSIIGRRPRRQTGVRGSDCGAGAAASRRSQGHRVNRAIQSRTIWNPPRPILAGSERGPPAPSQDQREHRSASACGRGPGISVDFDVSAISTSAQSWPAAQRCPRMPSSRVSLVTEALANLPGRRDSHFPILPKSGIRRRARRVNGSGHSATNSCASSAKGFCGCRTCFWNLASHAAFISYNIIIIRLRRF